MSNIIRESPVVSVVVPIYNPGVDFMSALQSVLGQDYPHFEVVISDDGRFDVELLPRDPRVKYVRNDSRNRGIFPNLNNAIRNSSGEVIQVFCQDDLMATRFLSEQVRILNTFRNAGMIFSSFEDIYGNGSAVDLTLEETRVLDLRYYHSNFFLNKLFVKGCMPGNLSPVMIRRSAYDILGEFDESFKYCGDFEYWIRLGQKFDVIYHSNRLLFVRNHSEQASNTLPLDVKISEERICYLKLLELNTIRVSKDLLLWYFNERVGVQHFVNFVRSNRKGVSRIKDIFSYPFDLKKILILTILSVKNKLRIIKIDEEDF